MKKIYFAALLIALPFVALAEDSYLVGDVNGDGVVDTLDVAAECQYIVQLNPTPFIASRADVNSDGVVNVDDATAIVEIIVPASDTPVAAPRRVDDDGAILDDLYKVTMSSIICTPGEKPYLDIFLTNPANTITSFQMELVLPSGVTIVGDPTFTDRAPFTHHIYDNRIATDRYMMVCVSNSLATFTGESGALLRVQLDIPADYPTGDFTIKLEGIRLDRPRQGGFDVADAESSLDITNVITGIDQVIATQPQGRPQFYTITGQPVPSNYRGIVVVRDTATSRGRLTVLK